MASTQSHSSANEEENTVTIVGATMIVLAVVSVVFRFYTRYRMKTALWWDDWMALTAVLTAVTAGVLVLAGKSTLKDRSPEPPGIQGFLTNIFSM